MIPAGSGLVAKYRDHEAVTEDVSLSDGENDGDEEGQSIVIAETDAEGAASSLIL